jgi:lipopolysaccharide export system ATP-binding protein
MSNNPKSGGMLTAQHLLKSFAGRRIIENVTLSLGRGEIVALLGPNGAGKTTTFQLLTGMAKPDGGSIKLDGTDITNMPFYDRARFGISYLPQASFVPRSLSVEDNILLVLEARLPEKGARKARLAELVAEFRLGDIRTKAVGELSGGQRRRCEIAITLACEPSFAMLDEPFAGVDPRNTEEIITLIRHLADRDIGVLITDHKARELLGIADRAYVIESGSILAHGDVDDIVADRDVRRIYLGQEFRL